MKKKLKVVVSIILSCVVITTGFLFFNFLNENNKKPQAKALTHNQIAENVYTGNCTTKGGFIYLASGSKYIMSEGEIKNKYALFGGAVYVGKGAEFTMSGGAITECYAEYGGAIYVANGGKCFINGGTIEGNFAEKAPAIFVENGGILEVAPSVNLNNNDIIKLTPTTVNIYVDGSISKTLELCGNYYELQENQMPLSYENCNGYFANSGLTKTNENNTVDLTNGTVSLYTKPAAVSSAVKFVLNDDGASYSMVMPKEGDDVSDEGTLTDYVMPREYNNKPVTKLYGSTNSSSSVDVTSFTFNDLIEVVGENAFAGCDRLTSVVITDKIIEVEENAFADCEDVSVNFSASTTVPTISDSAFSGETAGHKIIVSDDMLESWQNAGSNGGFSNNIFSEDELFGLFDSSTGEQMYTWAQLLSSRKIEVVNGVLTSNDSSMSGKLVIGNEVHEIANNAFSNHGSLTEIVLPNGLRTIGSSAFSNCYSLTQMFIPTTVSEMNNTGWSDSPFMSCSSSLKIYCGASEQPSGWGSDWNTWTYWGYPVLLENVAWGCSRDSEGNLFIPREINVYVDGSFYDKFFVYGDSYKLKEKDLPLSYEDCVGYYFDELLTKSIENGIEFESLSINIYTKRSNNNSDFRFTYNAKTDTYDISAASTRLSGNVVIPREYNNKLTNLAENAFAGCANITSIILHTGITKISDNAFVGCGKIEEYNFVAFSQIPELGENVFEGISEDCKIIVPVHLYAEWRVRDGWVSWKEYITNEDLFYGLFDPITGEQLYTWQQLIDDGKIYVEYFGVSGSDPSIEGELIIYKDITSIGSRAFAGCEGLTKVVLGSDVHDINESAFEGCVNLKSIIIPNSVSYISGYAFQGCTSLTSVFIPSSVRSIYSRIFYGCSSDLLIYCESIRKPNYWNDDWNEYSYSSDSKLSVFWGYKADDEGNIILGNNVNIHVDGKIEKSLYIDAESYQFNIEDMPLNYENCVGYYLDEELTIPINADNLIFTQTDRNINLFTKKASNLSSFIFTYNAQTDTYNVGAASTSLSGEVVIPKEYNGKTTSLAEGAFAGCENITKIVLHTEIKNIPNNAFAGCFNILEYNFSGIEDMPSVGTNVFDGINEDCRILVSENLYDQWISENNLSNFVNYIINDDSLYGLFDSETGRQIHTWKELIKSSKLEVTEGALIGYDDSLAGKLIIHKNVNAIGKHAFQGFVWLTDVVIIGPKIIDEYAFNSCQNLKSVYISKTVEEIRISEYYTIPFENCGNATLYCEDDEKPEGWHEEWYSYTYRGYYVYLPVVWGVVGDEHGSILVKKKVNVYVDGEVQATITMTAGSYIFNAEDMPLSLEECCGYFIDPQLKTSAEGRQFVFVGIDGDINLYTKRSNDASDFIFTYNSQTDTYDVSAASTSLSGEVVVPKEHNGKITSLAEGAFAGCENITNIVLHPEIANIPNSAFAGCVNIKEYSYVAFTQIPTLGENVFDGINENCRILVPGSLYDQWIGESNWSAWASYIVNEETLYGLFDSDTGEQTYTWQELIDNGIVSTDNNILYGSDSSISGKLVIPNGIKEIGSDGFYNFNGLTEVVLPYGIKTLDWYAFQNCGNLKSINLPDSITTITSYSFQNCISLVDIVLPAGLTEIDNNLFEGCTSLKSVEISENVGEIGSLAFYGCTSLESISLPENLLKINDQAFAYCSSLTQIYIPQSVSTIYCYDWQSAPFLGCSEDFVIYCEATKLPGGWSSDWNASTYSENVKYYPVNWGYVIDENGEIVQGKNVKIYVDNEVVKSLIITGENYEFNIQDMPVSLENCCGYYIDSELTISAENKTFNFSEINGGIKLYTKRVNNLSNFIFTYNEQTDTYDVSASSTSLSGEIVIPKEYNGKLTSLAEGAFAGCSDISEIILHIGIANIPDNAFNGCYNILSYNFMAFETIPTLGENVFEGINVLCKINVPKALINDWMVSGNWIYWAHYIINEDSLYGLFDSETGEQIYTWKELISLGKILVNNGELSGLDSTMAGKLIIHKTVRVIAEKAFYNFSKLTSIIISEGVTTISSSAFQACTGLKLVFIPSSVTTVLCPDGHVAPFIECSKNIVIYCGLSSEPEGYENNWNCYSHSYDLATVFWGCDVDADGNIIIEKNFNIVDNNETVHTMTFTGGSYTFNLEDMPFGFDESIGYFLDDALTIPADGKSFIFAEFEGDINLYTKLASDLSNLKFVYNEQADVYEVSAINTGITGEIVIPKEYNGKPVQLAKNAFISCNRITKVFIPEGITTIPANAFSGCNALETINLVYGIESIEEMAFARCNSLTDLVIHNGVKTIKDSAFLFCVGLTELIIPQSVAEIGPYAFSNCKGLTKVDVFSETVALDNYAFNGCNNVKKFNFKGNISTIGDYAFNDCLSVVEYNFMNNIEIPTLGNNAFMGIDTDCSIFVPISLINDWKTSGNWSAWADYIVNEDGLFGLFDQETGEQIYTWQELIDLEKITITDGVLMGNDSSLAGKLVIHRGVVSIGDYAFSCYENLTTVIISEGVEKIGSCAFENCYNLKTVYISSTVETISVSSYYEAPFYGCYEITNIYCGDESKPNGWGQSWNCYTYRGYDVLLPVVWGSAIDSNGNIIVNKNIIIYVDGTVYQTITLKAGSYTFNIEDMPLSYEYCVGYFIDSNLTTSAEGVVFNFLEIDGNINIYTKRCTDPSNFTFIYNEETDTYDIKATNLNLSGEVILPKLYNGKQITLAERAFEGCANITGLVLSSAMTVIPKFAFRGCYNLSNIVLFEGITAIGEYAFAECLGLIDFAIPSTVTEIGVRAFDGCCNLTSINIPEGVQTIAEGVFNCCCSLTEITLPSSIESICDYAFNDCSNILEYDFMSHETIPTLGANAFAGINENCRIYVPYDLEDDWKVSEGWMELSNYIDGEALYFGLFDSETGEQIYKWQELVDLGKVIATNGALKGNDTTLAGKLVIHNSMTSIAEKAFYNNDQLTEVVIPNSVVSIGSNAFYSCNKLTSVIISEGVTTIGNYAFGYCNKLAEINIPNSVTTIGNYAFQNCSKLTGELIISKNLINIGQGAFAGCSYTSIVVDSGNSVYDSRNNCNAIIKTSTSELVAGCNNTDFDLVGDITRIGNYAFYNCSKLTNITLPSTLTYIGSYAFYNCSKLTVINLQRVVTIGSYAFQGCSNLTGELIISKNLTSIGQAVFAGCAFTSIVVDSANIVYDSRNNCNAIIKTSSNELISGFDVTDLSLATGITSIGYYAFSQCKGLVSVVIPNGVTSIGNYAFHSCSNLTSITLPDGLLSLGTDYAFYGCSALKTIYIPASVETIKTQSYNYSPFYNCSSSLVIYCGAEGKPEGWGDYWNYYSSNKTLTVKWGYTRAEYEAEVGLTANSVQSFMPTGVYQISLENETSENLESNTVRTFVKKDEYYDYLEAEDEKKED